MAQNLAPNVFAKSVNFASCFRKIKIFETKAEVQILSAGTDIVTVPEPTKFQPRLHF